MTVKKAAANEGIEEPRVRKFRFDADYVFGRGEKAFRKTYDAFTESMHRHVVSTARFCDINGNLIRE